MRYRSSLAAAVLLSAIPFAAQPALAEDQVIANGLRVESFIPLSELAQRPDVGVIRAVDPLAVYSNVTNFLGQAFAQGPAAGGITRLVMDDLTFTTDPAVGAITTLRFSVANLNAVAHSVRARVRVWNADGAPLGAGLPNGPGTYYSPGGTPVGFSFNAITFNSGLTTLTGNVAFTLPAGVTTTLWFGLTFDNVGSTTGATDADMSNFGQAFFSPPNLGTSTNILFQTTAAGNFFPNDNPAGAGVTFAVTANQGWELVVATLPVELTGFSVD